MGRPKKDLVLPHLNDCGGDLSRQWYVEAAIRNPENDVLERYRIYDGLSLPTLQERYNAAEEIIIRETSKIKKSKNQIIRHDKYEFIDLLDYQNVVTYQRSKKITSNSLLHKMMCEYLYEKSSVLKKKSLQNYVSKLRRFYDFLVMRKLINISPTSVTNALVIEYLKHITVENDLSRPSVWKYQQVLYSFFKFMKTKALIKNNPVFEVPNFGKIVDEASYPIPKHDRDKLAKLIKKEDPQLWLACCMEYYMAIRPGEEIRAMKVGQVNINSKKIIVKSYIAKNSKSETIDMPEQLYREFKKHNLDRYPAEFYIFSHNGMPGPKMRGVNNLANRFNSFRKRLNLPSCYKFYSWKHSGAEALADAGTSIWELQSHLRHQSVTTTEQYTRKRIGSRSDSIKNNFPDIY